MRKVEVVKLEKDSKRLLQMVLGIILLVLGVMLLIPYIMDFIRILLGIIALLAGVFMVSMHSISWRYRF